MIQRRGGLRFALEPSSSLRIFSAFVGKEFQGHKAAQLYILGLVDHAHPTPAELLDDAVVGDDLTDHAGTSLGDHLGAKLPRVNVLRASAVG